MKSWFLGVGALLMVPGTLLSATYHLSFDDEFNTLSLWNGSTGWQTTDAWGTHYYNDEQQYYVGPSSGYNPFSVSNGILSITADKAANHPGVYSGGHPVLSGMMSSYGQMTQQYGYFEMRGQVPTGQGYWSAFWMDPADKTWPPEYDIFEILGDGVGAKGNICDTRSIYQTAHWTGSDGKATGQGINYQNHIDAADGMHTYGFLWTPDTVSWYVDGLLTQVQPNVVNKPMYVMLNLAVGAEWPGYIDDSTPFPSSLKADYIRVYSIDPNVRTVSPQAGYAESSTVAALNNVPEPASLCLLGLAGLGLRRSRRCT